MYIFICLYTLIYIGPIYVRNFISTEVIILSKHLLGICYIYVHIYVYISRMCSEMIITSVDIKLRTYGYHMQSNPYVVPRDVASSSRSAHETVWGEIPWYTVFRFTVTLDTPPQVAVNKQWRCSIIVLKRRVNAKDWIWNNNVDLFCSSIFFFSGPSACFRAMASPISFLQPLQTYGWHICN
jgi:hypothetical protein